jgi:hypothetical protein
VADENRIDSKVGGVSLSKKIASYFDENIMLREERQYYIGSRIGGGGGYLGPFYCSDNFLGESTGYLEKQCATSTRSSEYWFNLDVDQFRDGFIAAELIDKQSIKLWKTFHFKLDIKIIDKVALVEFSGEPMIEILNSCSYWYLCDDGRIMGERYNYSGRKMPLAIYCATEKIIVFDLLKNNSRLLEDVSQKESVENFKNLVGSSSYPYVLRYIDDDELWGASKSISNSDRSAYIFLGDDNLHIISNIPYVFCSFNMLLNKRVSIK